MNPPVSLGEHLAGGALSVVLATLFPRLAYRARWPTRLGPRGLLGYAVWLTAFQFALRHFVFPWVKRIADERDRLAERLGREPTDDELADHLGYSPST